MAGDDAAGACVRQARQDLCRFLSACWCQPEPAFAEERLFDSMQAAAALVDPGLEAAAERLGRAFAALPLQELLVDYTRLLLGPVDPRARPYGSFWLGEEPGPGQPSTQALAALHHETGFEVAPEAGEAPDHVALELEFLYVLMHRQDRALQQRLLREHLGAWVGPFTDAVQAGAETAFYRELASATRRYVELQAAALANG